MIQDHKGTGVSFRNLWIIPDVDYESFLRNFGNASQHFVEAIPEPTPITALPLGMVSDMDVNGDHAITPEEFVDYRARQFGKKEKDGDGFLDAEEFPHSNSFRAGDKNQDGKLSREEYLEIFRKQFPNVDLNKDGEITAADKKQGVFSRAVLDLLSCGAGLEKYFHSLVEVLVEAGFHLLEHRKLFGI